MPEVVVVRHASTAWSGRRYCGRSDPGLDHRGRAAAAQLAAELAPTLPGSCRIVSSPRRRAIQTAEAILRWLPSARIDIDERWAEVDFGAAEGLTFEELERLAPDLAAHLAAGTVEIDWPSGETHAAFCARIEAAWLELATASAPAVVVSHGGAIRVAIGLATGRPITAIAVPEPGATWRGELPSPRSPATLAATP